MVVVEGRTKLCQLVTCEEVVLVQHPTRCARRTDTLQLLLGPRQSFSESDEWAAVAQVRSGSHAPLLHTPFPMSDESHQRQQATSKLKRWLWMSPEVELKKYTDKDGRSGTTYLMKNANVERVRGPRALVHGAISAVTPGMKTELLGAAAASTATGSALASEIVGVGTLGVQYATDTAQDSLMATAGSKGLTDLLGKVDSTTVDAAYSAASQVATAAVGAKAAGVVAATTQLPAATTVVAGTILAFGAGSMKCDLVAGILAVIISSAVMYPIDTMKTRVQVGKARVPKAGPLALFKGIWLSILKKAPEASVYIVLNRFARNKFVHDGFTVGNRIIEPELFFDWMVAAAIGPLCPARSITAPFPDSLRPIPNPMPPSRHPPPPTCMDSPRPPSAR